MFAHAVQRAFPEYRDLAVLDVGGGDGCLGTLLCCRSYVCTDLDVHTNRIFQHAAADAHMLPFRDRSFDLVLSKQTLPHYTDPVIACLEMARVARTGVMIRQEFPDGGPIGWPNHSRVTIDSPADIVAIFAGSYATISYDGVDFVVKR